MAAKKPTPDDSKSPQAAELQRAMFEAYQLLHETHINYTQALAVARDTELSDDGMLALRNQGRIYAEAVIRYTNAVMAWLALIEDNEEAAIKFMRQGTGANETSATSVSPSQLRPLPEKS